MFQRALRARQTFSLNAIELKECGPQSGKTVDTTQVNSIDAYHTWRNDNPSSDTTYMNAYVEAQVLVDGDPVPITVDAGDQYVRQVGEDGYEVLIEPESSHTVTFSIPTASLPTGSNMDYGVYVVSAAQRALNDF